MSACCWWRILTLPFGWRGVTTYCRCGNRLRCDGNAWVVAR